jgi:hypothetical protein
MLEFMDEVRDFLGCSISGLTTLRWLYRTGVYTKPGTYIHSNARHIQLRGGTLSECAGREQKGGTFHFGNVPGLVLTILGIDTCPFFDLFSSSHYHSWPNKPTNASKACPL